MSSSFNTKESLSGRGVTILPLGALIQSFRIGPSQQNIVQNFPTADLYREYNVPYFGETIGRVANRISGAKIHRLNGQAYELAANNGPNSLHGGVEGWGKKVWEGPNLVERDGREQWEFRLLSKDGEEGFPGELECRVWYAEGLEAGPNGEEVSELEMEYEAELVGEKGVGETVVNLTNHSYFNLSGSATIENTIVELSTTRHLQVDDTSIPLGTIALYPGITANSTFTLGASEPDIDHCFIMNSTPSTVPIDTRLLPLCKLATFFHPDSQIHLEVYSTEPAFQFYTGKYIDVPAVGGLAARGARSGFCVEPSRYVNAINMEEWRDMVVLKRGQKYGSRIVYRGWQEKK